MELLFRDTPMKVIFVKFAGSVGVLDALVELSWQLTLKL